jgi:hypothetical protein
VLSLRQVTISFTPIDTDAQIKSKAEAFGKAAQAMQGCGGADVLAKTFNADVVDNDQIRVRDLPGALQDILLGLQVGQVGEQDVLTHKELPASGKQQVAGACEKAADDRIGDVADIPAPMQSAEGKEQQPAEDGGPEQEDKDGGEEFVTARAISKHICGDACG